MLVLLDILFDTPGEFHIAAMSRTVGNDMGLDGVSDQGEVAHNIEQFVAGRFIRETQFQVIG